ncbi:MAG: substrate-binding domain-containing protein, partial [Hyphomonas sp.]|nr:substrate-binding domain-containing protein [Hyphomonas sp.]
IAFLGDTDAPEVLQRYEGYVDAHRRAGLTIDPELTVPANFEVESAEAALGMLLERGIPFDGVFAASDLIGLGVIRCLLRTGVSVPGDVSVVGYDNLQLAAYSHPSL